MKEHSPLPWVAIEGDTFHRDRPWGVCRYLSLEACREIDGDDAVENSRTEVIAEVCGPSELAKADSEFIVRAVNHHDELVAALRNLVNFQKGREEWPEVKAAEAVLAKAEGGAA